MNPKYPSESLTILTDLVLPSETNPLNNLFGELLARMDRAASTARRHSEECCNSICKSRINRAIPLGSGYG
jgi:acyl-CoA hydrolase